MKKAKIAEYRAWTSMRQRCLNPNNHDYKNYGGRGVTICERWSNADTFIADMGKKPSPELTLERLNNSLGYCPENCVWATRMHQIKNRRKCIRNQWHLSLTLREICHIVGIKYGTYRARVKSGMTQVQAVFTPARKRTVA